MANLILRRATIDDAQLLFDWRNDPLTRAGSRHTDVIEWATHLKWLQSSLRQPWREIFIAECDGTPVGTIRLDYDYSRQEVEFSASVAPGHRGKGIYTTMYGMAVEVARMPTLVDFVKIDNEPALRVVRKCGFDLVSVADGLMKFQRTKAVADL